MADEGAVKVCVRVRPLIAREHKDQGDNVAVLWKADHASISQIDGAKSFTFDRVFSSEETTCQVYQEMAVPIINSVMQGYNGTIFAYGQTSSGKTYTMMGTTTSMGIIPRAMHEVFKVINETPNREFLLRVSYMEIYNETVTDLLCADRKKKPLEIREDMNRNVYVADLTEELVVQADELMHWIKKGEKCRHYGETKMNEHSSRSHTILRMIIESRERTEPANTENCDGVVMVSHLNLVDLAGSERASQTGAEGLRLKEGCNINRSLFVLGQVIKKLSDGQVGGFINYRDSKLTRILQNSLGGNAKTVIICTITPVSFDETLSTLQFASTAKHMKNTPHVNEVLDDEALLKRYRKEIMDLKKQLEELENSSETRAKAMAADERAQLLEEIQLLHKEKEERTRNLTKIVVIPSSHVSNEDFRAKRKRRVTWAPGNIAGTLCSTDNFGIGLNTSTLAKKQKFMALSTLPEMDDSEISDFDDPLSRTVDDMPSELEWSSAIQLRQRDKVFSSQNLVNDPAEWMKHQSSFSSSNLDVTPPENKELELKVEGMEKQLHVLIKEKSDAIEKKDALQVENVYLQQQIISKEHENNEIVKRLEITIADLQQQLHTAYETKEKDFEESHPLQKLVQSLEDKLRSQSQGATDERTILEKKISMLEEALQHRDNNEVTEPPNLEAETPNLEAELHNGQMEEKMVLEQRNGYLEEIIERMTNVARKAGEGEKCNEDLVESIQLCEALMLEKENALSELDSVRGEFLGVLFENEKLKQEIKMMDVQLQEKRDLFEFEILEKEVQKEQEKELMHDIASLKKVVQNAELNSQECETELQAKAKELEAKSKLLKERENQVAELEKLVGKLQKKVVNMDMSVSMGSTERFCDEILQLKQSLSDAEIVTRDAQKESAFLRSENIELKQKMYELSNTYSQMEKDVAMYKGQLESEKSRFKKMQVDLQKELQYVFNENTKLYSLMDGKVPKDLLSRVELERKLTDLTKQLDKAIEEKSELLKEVAVLSDKSLPNKIERLKKQLCETSEELCLITSEKEKLILTLADQDCQMQILKDHSEKVKQDFASIQPKYEQAQRDYFELRQQHEVIVEEHQAKTETINEMQSQVGILSRDAQQQQQSLQSAKEELSSLVKELQQKTRENEKHIDENKELKVAQQSLASDNVQLEELLKVRESVMETIEEKKVAAMLEVHKLQDEILSLSREKEELEQMHAVLLAERDQLKENVHKSHKELTEGVACEIPLIDTESNHNFQLLQEKILTIAQEKDELQSTLEAIQSERDQLLIDREENIEMSIETQEQLRQSLDDLKKQTQLVEDLKKQIWAQSDIMMDPTEASSDIKKLSSLMEELRENRKEREHITDEKKQLEQAHQKLASEVEQLEEKLKASDSALKTVEEEKKELEQAHQRLASEVQLEEKLKASDSALKTVEEGKKQLEQAHQRLASEVEQLEEKLKASDSALKTVEEVKKELEQAHQRLASEVQQLEEKLKASDSALKTVEEEKKKLEQAHQNLASEVRELQDRLNDSDFALKTADEEKIAAMLKLQDFQLETTALTQERDELQKREETCRAEKDQLNEDMKTNLNQLSSLMEELRENRKETEHITDEKKELVRAHQRLESEVQEMEEKLKASDSALKTAEEEKKELAQAHQRLASQVQELEEQLQASDSAQKTAEEEKKKLEQAHRRFASQVQELEERLKASDSALKTMEEERITAMLELQRLQAETTALTQERAKLQKMEETCRAERDQFHENMETNLKQMMETQEQLRMTQERLEHQKCLVSELRRQISECSLTMNKSSEIQTASSLEEKLSDLMEELQQRTNENKVVLNEQKELECRFTSEVQQLEEQLKSCKSLLEMVEVEKCAAIEKLQELQEGAAALTQENLNLQEIQETLRAERDHLNEDLQKNLSLMSSLMEELQNKAKENEQFHSEKIQLEQRLSSEMQQLEVRLKACESVLETVEDEKREALQKLQVLQEDATALTQERNELKQIQETLQTERDQLREGMQENRKQLSSIMELQQQSKQTEQIVDQKREIERRLAYEVQELEERLKASESALKTVEGEKCAALHKLQELEDQSTALTRENNELQQIQERLRAEKDQLDEDVQKSQTGLSSLMEELQHRSKEKEEIIDQKRELEQRLSSEVQELEQLKASNPVLESVEEIKKLEQRMTCEVQDLEERLKASETALNTVEGEKLAALQKLQELEDKSRAVSQENNELHQIQETLRAKVDQLNQDMQKNNSLLSSLMEELQQKSKETEHIIDEKRELEQRASSGAREFEERLTASESALKTVEEEKCAVLQKLQQLQEELTALCRENNELQQIQETLRAERDQLNEDAKKNQTRLSSLMEELQEKSKETEHIIHEKRELEQRASSGAREFEERLTASESALKTVEGEKCAVLQKLQQLQEELTALIRENNELQQIQETLSAERDQLNEDAKKNQTRLSSLMEELQQKSKETEHVIDEKRELEQRASSRAREFEERLTASESALKTVEGEKCAVLQKLQQLQEELTALSRENNELQQIQETLRSERDQLNEDVKKNQTRLSSLMEELQHKCKETEHIIDEKRELEQRASSGAQEFEERLTASESALKTVEGEKCAVLQKLQQLQEELTALCRENNELQQIQETLRAERDQLYENTQKNQTRLSSLMEELQLKSKETEHIIDQKRELEQRASSEVREFEERLTASESALKVVEGDKCAVLQKLQQLQEELTALSRENSKLQQMQETLRAERDQLNENAQKNQTRLSSLMEELQLKSKETERIVDQKRELEQRASSEAREFEERLTASESALKVVEGEKCAVLQELQQLQEELTALSRGNSKLQQMQETLRAERDQLNENSQKNQTRLLSLMEELQHKSKETEHIIDQKRELEQRASSEAQEFEERLTASESALKIVEGEKCSVLQKLQQLQEELTALSRKNSELQQIQETLRAEMDQLNENAQKNQTKLSSLMEELQHKSKETEHIVDEKRELEQRASLEAREFEERLTASDSALKVVEGEKCAVLQKLQQLQEELTALSQENNELQQLQETLRAERDQLNEDAQKNQTRLSSLMEELQHKSEETEHIIGQKRELEQRASSEVQAFEERLTATESALKIVEGEKCAVLQKLKQLQEELTALSREKNELQQIKETLRVERDQLKEDVQKNRSRGLSDEIRSNNELSEQVLMEKDIAKHIRILETKNQQMKALLKKYSPLYADHSSYLNRISHDLLKEVAAQKERMDIVKHSLSSTLSRPFEKLNIENLKLNTQIQTMLNKLKFVCDYPSLDEQYTIATNFEKALTEEYKKEDELKLQCFQKYGNTWKASFEELKNKELQSLNEFLQKSDLVQQIETDLSEIENSLASIWPDLQQEINARKDIMHLLDSCTEINFDATKLNEGLQLENKRIGQFILLENAKMKPISKLKTPMKIRAYLKSCDLLLHEKKESNSELLKLLQQLALGAGGHLAVEENQKLFNKLQATQEEVKKMKIQIQTLEHELSVVQQYAKQKEEKTATLEKQYPFELHKLQTKLVDGEKNLRSVLAEMQALQVKVEAGAKPYEEDIHRLKNELVNLSMEKSKLSKYTDQEIAFLKSSVEDKDELVRKLKEQLRRVHQDQDSTVVLENQHSQSSNLTLTCGGGSGIVQSTAMLVMKSEKAKLEKELSQLKKKCERLLRNEAMLKEEIRKWRERAMTYAQAEVSQKPHPKSPGKTEASTVNEVPASSECQESTSQEIISLRTPKSTFFDPGSDSLPVARPAQFFDNSSLGTFSDAGRADTEPEKDPNEEWFKAPSKGDSAQECRMS